MKHTSDIISFLVGLILPGRFIWLGIARFVAVILGRRALEQYLDEHFPRKVKRGIRTDTTQ